MPSCRKVYGKCPCWSLSQQRAPTANIACSAPVAVAASTCTVPQERHPPFSGLKESKGPGKTNLPLCIAELCLLDFTVIKKQGGWKGCFFNTHEMKEKWSGLHCPVLRQFKEIRQSLDTPGLQRRFYIIHWKVEIEILIISHTENSCYHNL